MAKLKELKKKSAILIIDKNDDIAVNIDKI
jgi:hypothetical protein